MIKLISWFTKRRDCDLNQNSRASLKYFTSCYTLYEASFLPVHKMKTEWLPEIWQNLLKLFDTQTRNAYSVFVVESDGNRPLQRPRYWWEELILGGGVNWIYLNDQSRDHSELLLAFQEGLGSIEFVTWYSD
jgi:hypothetical protein